MTDDDMKNLRTLCTAATPGPWSTDRFDTHSTVYRGNAICGRAIATLPYEYNPRDEENAAFIARARTALPAALDEIERLRGEMDEFCAQRAEWLTAKLDAETERDAYRAMLADLVSACSLNAVRRYASVDAVTARARDLLKNGPTPAAREPVYRCGVCLDGNSPCPVIDPPGVTKWTCLACGRIVGSGKGANDE